MTYAARKSRTRSALAALVVAVATCAPLGCITREVIEPIYDRERVEVILVEQRRGSTVLERGFAHPTKISEQRLANILGSVEIRGREAQLAGMRYVFETDTLSAVSAALAYGLMRADPNQAIAIRFTSKVVQHGIFDRKFITSFVSYVQDDLLYLHVSRVDWPLPDVDRKTAPPLPRVDEHPMKFKLVPAEAMFAEGNYAVSVEWQNPLFRQPPDRIGSGEKGERTILLEDDAPPEKPASGIPTGTLSRLTPEQLRELADLEEQRQNGTLTEGHYRRLRQNILDKASKN